MLTKRANMPFLSLHTLAAARGDGLPPEFVKLFTRLAAGADATLSESAQPPVGFTFEPVREGPASRAEACRRPHNDTASARELIIYPFYSVAGG